MAEPYEEEDSTGMRQIILRGLPPTSVLKFNNFFKQHLVNMLAEEAARDPYSQSSIDAPKYSVCFMDLAEFLNLKDDVFAKLEEMQNDENENLATEELIVFSARKEREARHRNLHSNSTPGFTNNPDTSAADRSAERKT